MKDVSGKGLPFRVLVTRRTISGCSSKSRLQSLLLLLGNLFYIRQACLRLKKVFSSYYKWLLRKFDINPRRSQISIQYLVGLLLTVTYFWVMFILSIITCCHTFNPVVCQLLLSAGEGGGGGGESISGSDPKPSTYRLGSRVKCLVVLNFCPFVGTVVRGRAMFRGMMSP